MSIEVIYQGLTIARGPGFRLQDGGVFVELDGPMPVATQLSLTHGDNALQGRVRRVTEGTGAGMLIVPTAGQKLPRWLLPLGPTSVTNVELEPEPTPAAVDTKPAAGEPAAVAVGDTVASDGAPAQILPGEPAPSGDSPVAAGDAAAANSAVAATAAEGAANGDAGHDAGESAAASGHTPSEHADGAKDDDEDDKHAAKPNDKKTPATGAAAKKKKPRKR